MSRGPGRPSWRGSALGLSIEAAGPIPGIAEEQGRGRRRHVRWHELPEAELAKRSPRPRPQSLVDLRHPDGRLFMRVEGDPDSGYRVEAPGFGTHVVSGDGATVWSALPQNGRRWQRLFFAQVLPIAAAASGLDVLHAGAVGIDGKAFGFVAPSGTGKTSIVLHLVATGADFIADDVLALDLSGSRVEAFPGPAVASVDERELEALDDRARHRLVLDRWSADDGKVQIDVASAAESRPLEGLFFLERSDGPDVTVTATTAAPVLLRTAFVPYVQTAARAEAHLTVAAAIASRGRTYSVTIPPGASAREVAGRIRSFGAAEGLW